MPSGSDVTRGGRTLGDLLGLGVDPVRRAIGEVFGRREVVQEVTAPPVPLRAFVAEGWHVTEPETPFTPNWHVDAVCEHLEWLATGEIQRLVINIPPGHAKSLVAAVLWPAWMWTWRPGWRSIFGSYDAVLSLRDSVKSRAVMMSPWYQERFTPAWRFTSDQNVKGYFRNSRMGERIAVSVGSAATGFRGNCVAVDDPLNVGNRHFTTEQLEAVIHWWDVAMSSRLNDQRTDARMIIMQRLHERDLTGHVLAKGGYVHLCLPTEYDPARRAVTVTTSGHTWSDPRTAPNELLFPERFSRAVIDQARTDLGSGQFAAQHQQLPVPAAGGIFQRAWFKRYHRRELPPVWEEVIQSWDMTFKKKEDADFVVGDVWGRLGADYYLLSQRRGRMGFVDSKRALREVTAAWPQATAKLIEDKANGPAIMDDLRAEIEGLIGVSDPGGVLAQAWAVQPLCEAGNVHIPADEEWPEAADWLDEVCGYPKAANDDRVAAMTQALVRLSRNRRRRGGAAPDPAKPSEAATIARQKF